MAPSATDEQPAAAQPEEKTYPPAKIYPVTETRFEKYVAPDSEGRKRALEQSGNAAIVIDNGEPPCSLRRLQRRVANSDVLLTPATFRILCCSSRLVV